MLPIPQKRFGRAPVSFLTPAETGALLAAPDPGRWEGRRDRALLTLAAQTGLRLAELTGLTCSDIQLSAPAHVRCTGKGRKQRCVPLTPATAAVVRAWLRERGNHPGGPLFPTRTGRRLSDDAVERRVAIHAQHAAQQCPSLASKNVTPHTLRHTAMALLQGRGVASDATFRFRREAGAVGDGGPGKAGWRSRRQSEPAGQMAVTG